MEFRYEAVNQEGRLLKGQLRANSELEAIRLLAMQDLTPTQISAIGTAAKSLIGHNAKPASIEERIFVVRELATLLGAGVSIAEAVDSTSQAHAESQIGKAFAQVYAQLRSGEPLSHALRISGLDFPDYLYQLVSAGELTGKLAVALNSAADQMEYEHKVRQDMRNALIYPSILVFSGIAATLLIFIIVVPKFTNMLKNTHVQLPQISIWVLKTGLFVKENLLWFSLGMAGAVLGIMLLFSNPRVRRRAVEVLSRGPIVGEWIINSEIGRWALMLGTLLENKVPIVRAMELAESGVRLTALSQKLRLAVKELRAGNKLSETLATHQTVNPMGVNLIRVGERSGDLGSMLKTLGRLYENLSRERMKRFLILLEPATILVIGCVIGFIMVAIMLAITSLSNVSF